MTFTENELVLVSEFRKTTTELLLHNDYEKTNEFLITWIRYKYDDLKKAEQALRNYKKWRMDYNMDNISSEDMKEMETEFPIEFPGFDNVGCPIIGMHLNKDLRKIVNCPGGKERYVRYFLKNYEHAIYLMRKQHFLTEGRVNNIIFIVDMEGFYLTQVTSPNVIATYIECAKHLEGYYPGIIQTAYIFNTPKWFQIPYNIIKPFLSTETLSRLKIFNSSNNEQFDKILRKDFSSDQLPSFIKINNKDY